MPTLPHSIRRNKAIAWAYQIFFLFLQNRKNIYPNNGNNKHTIPMGDILRHTGCRIICHQHADVEDIATPCVADDDGGIPVSRCRSWHATAGVGTRQYPYSRSGEETGTQGLALYCGNGATGYCSTYIPDVRTEDDGSGKRLASQKL